MHLKRLSECVCINDVMKFDFELSLLTPNNTHQQQQ